jgi:hypothetical protein
MTELHALYNNARRQQGRPSQAPSWYNGAWDLFWNTDKEGS